MSSGMNMKEAEKIAEKMTYKEAVMNCLSARCVPYRKATKIKMNELLHAIDNDFTEDLINQGYNKALWEALEVMSMVVDCNTCPLDCGNKTYKNCKKNLRHYILEQIKERDEMARVIKCDMCGKEMGKYFFSLAIKNDYSILGDICPTKRDLCEECMAKILTIIDSKERD